MASDEETPRRRGRPKGSGLDDTDALNEISALLAANPKLKPTTAIKSLGIDDPSAIRRLRDKLQARQNGTLPQPTARLSPPKVSIPAARQPNFRLPPPARNLDTRGGSSTRVRVRLGIPTDPPKQTRPSPRVALPSQAPVTSSPPATSPPATSPRRPNLLTAGDVVEHLRLVLEATATLARLQQRLLDQLAQETD